MKPSTHIDAAVLDNARDFDDPFYRRFRLEQAKTPLTLMDGIAKRYSFPTLYGDVTCAQGIFLCSYERAKARMLHPGISPVRMPRGRAIVAFSCYTYNKVLGVPPYNEIAMTFPVLVAQRVRLPVLPMLVPGYPGFGYHVFSMPVTSLENQIRGVSLWGLPKVVEEIALTNVDEDCVVTAKEPSGETYFTLRVPRTGEPTPFDVRSYLYSRHQERLVRSETQFKATFAVRKTPRVLLRRNVRPETPFLTLGDTKSGRALRDLEIEPMPLETRYAEHMTSAFALPEEGYEAPLRF